MSFQQLLLTLQQHLRDRVRNGMTTERALGRRCGLSQSHIHNVLKGARALTPDVADRILRALELTVFDLLPPGGQPASRATSR